MARFHVFTLIGALTLGGCTSAPVGKILEEAVQQKEVVLGVSTTVGAGRTVQAVVNPWTSADVDHLKMDLYKQVDGTFTQIASQETPPGSGVAKTVNFNHLKMNTTYKVVVTCLSASGASLNKADGSGEAVVTTTSDDYVPVSVTVNLADKVFDGTMHPVVSITDGTVNDTTTAESGAVANNK